ILDRPDFQRRASYAGFKLVQHGAGPEVLHGSEQPGHEKKILDFPHLVQFSQEFNFADNHRAPPSGGTSSHFRRMTHRPSSVPNSTRTSDRAILTTVPSSPVFVVLLSAITRIRSPGAKTGIRSIFTGVVLTGASCATGVSIVSCAGCAATA